MSQGKLPSIVIPLPGSSSLTREDEIILRIFACTVSDGSMFPDTIMDRSIKLAEKVLDASARLKATSPAAAPPATEDDAGV